MYIPKHNEEKRTDVLDRLMQSQPLASLITMTSSGLFATHLPLVLHRTDDQHAILRGHLARANRQWKDFSPEIDALAIFSGPQHYITPSWYPEKAETGKVVPTWNYAVVHAYGPLKIVEDPDWLLTHLNTLTDIHEATQPRPWSVADAPADFIASIARGIVGLELKVERLEGKWKVSQNQSAATQVTVAEGLDALNTEAGRNMQALVRAERR
jgi:transcriptional regulator